MLEFPLIKEIVEWFYSQKWPKAHRFLIGTNGTILTDESKNWLYKHREFLTVALSLDGNSAYAPEIKTVIAELEGA